MFKTKHHKSATTFVKALFIIFLFWLITSPQATVSAQQTELIDAMQNDNPYHIIVGDYNGDDMTEVLVFSGHGRILLYHFENNTWHKKILTTVCNNAIKPLALEDVDGDGIKDLVVSKILDPPWGSRSSAAYLLLLGNDMVIQQTTIIANTAGYYNGTLYDIDHDSNFELLLGEYRNDDRARVMIGEYNGVNFNLTTIYTSNEMSTIPQAGQVFDKSNAQIMVGTHTHGNIFLFDFENGNWNRKCILGENTGFISRAYGQDIDSDNLDEIVATIGRSPDGLIRVYEPDDSQPCSFSFTTIED